MTARARTEKLDLRISSDAKLRIVAAAEATNRTVTEFVLNAALRESNETLPDQTCIALSAEQWEAFMETLDAPAKVVPELARLFAEPSVFDIGEIA